jgi:hypothetical protein
MTQGGGFPSSRTGFLVWHCRRVHGIGKKAPGEEIRRRAIRLKELE